MAHRVTIQDIADELGLSRNTVSKALNNAGGLADATRERVIKKAMDMGYKQFAFLATDQGQRLEMPPAHPDGPNEIALLTTMFIDRDHFASLALDAMQNELSQQGYTLNTHRVSKDDIASCELPLTFRRDQVAAIVCIEMFDHAYDDMVCGLGYPTLFMDGPAKLRGYSLASDQLYMDNREGIARLVNDMLGRGFERIGFVGDWTHCQSFLERYLAFRNSMTLGGVPINESFCIRRNRLDGIRRRLETLDELPDLFICANDFVALDAHRALRKLGFDVPRDVMLTGFDDATVSRHWMPQFTTVHIHTQSMAYLALGLLITRMREPNLDYRQVYTQTDLIYRQSTERD